MGIPVSMSVASAHIAIVVPCFRMGALLGTQLLLSWLKRDVAAESHVPSNLLLGQATPPATQKKPANRPASS